MSTAASTAGKGGRGGKGKAATGRQPRISRLLHSGQCASRIGAGAAVYLNAVLEYLAAGRQE
jgi:hypothetical protein